MLLKCKMYSVNKFISAKDCCKVPQKFYKIIAVNKLPQPVCF